MKELLRLDQELVIDTTSPTAISQALAETPRKLAWYSEAEVDQKKTLEDLENRRNELYARLYLKTEQILIKKYQMEERKGRQATPTVEVVKSLVITDKEYVEMVNTISEARRKVGHLMVGRIAMAKRQEALLGIGSNFRAELSAHMRDSIKDTDSFKQLREEFYRSRGQ